MPVIGAHRGAAAAPARTPGPAPQRVSEQQVVQRYDQGDLLRTTTREFRARWGLGVCRVLVAQWLRTGGRLEDTPFDRAQRLERRLFESGRVTDAAGVGLDLERMLAGGMDSERATMLATNGLSVVASLPTTRKRSDLGSFLSQGGLFYVKLASEDERYGHAIGVVLQDGVVRLFDPNTRIVAADVRTLIRHLWKILDYWEYTRPYLVKYEADKVGSEAPSASASPAAAAAAAAASTDSSGRTPRSTP